MSDAPINSFNFLDELKTAVGGGGGADVPLANETTAGIMKLYGGLSSGNDGAVAASRLNTQANVNVRSLVYITDDITTAPQFPSWTALSYKTLAALYSKLMYGDIFPVMSSLKMTIPSNLEWLNLGNIPVWTDKGKARLRSAMVMMSNTSSASQTISAGTVFATFNMDVFTEQATWACALMHPQGTVNENTIKALSARSLSFTADQSIPANTTLYLLIEED